MSHTDNRGTTRELRAAVTAKRADRNAERDRRDWGNGGGPKFRKRARRRIRYTKRAHIARDLVAG